MPKYNPQVDALKEVDENILRRIRSIHNDRRNATVGEIAKQTGMTTSSVYVAIARLEKSGDIESVERENGRQRRTDLKLTPDGEKRAEQILMRHDLVMDWLTRLGIPAEEAEDEACRMEHGLTDNTLNAIRKHVEMAMMRMAGQSMPCVSMPAADGESRPAAAPEMLDLIKIAGGIGGLERLVDVIRDFGGMEPFSKQIDLFREVQTSFGGQDNLMVALELLKKIGDLQTLTQLLGMMDSGGSIQAFIELFEKERRLWRSFLGENK